MSELILSFKKNNTPPNISITSHANQAGKATVSIVGKVWDVDADIVNIVTGKQIGRAHV